MYLVYKTDVNHTYASRDLIGIATDQIFAIQMCQDKAIIEGEDLNNIENSDALHTLINQHQTQGYSGEGEFQYEKVKVNELI